MIIQTQSQLDDICATLSKKPYLTIDTEFLRDKTYYSKLCLVQLAAKGVEPVALDPISTDLDWTPFYKLMQNEKVIKVFHAARQDLEIFFQESGKIPHPIFDTQVAAMVCGYGESIAYARLVDDLTDGQIAKNAQFTDWSKRPLSEKQLTYALNDVTYLRDVYEILSKRLKKQDRLHWVEQEMEILTDPETYIMRPEDAWQRVKIRSDKPQVLAILQKLAEWRETMAISKNLPRGHIIKDDALANIALYQPKDKNAMSRIRGVPANITKGKHGPVIFDLIHNALNSPKDTWPKAKKHIPFPNELSPSLEMLKLLLKINSSQNEVAAKLIANAKDLEKIALDNYEDILCMQGWRFEIFGKDALALKEGKISLGLKDNKINKFKI